VLLRLATLVSRSRGTSSRHKPIRVPPEDQQGTRR